MCTAPILLYKYLIRGKYRGILAIRLGIRVPDVVLEPNKAVLWVHAASLGEMRAAHSFVKKLQQQFPQKQILLSCLTNTGFQEAQKIAGAVAIILPSDLYTARLIKKVDPEVLFLVEGDIWPNMVREAKKVIVINGKISEKTALWFKRLPFIKRWLLDPIDLWCVQSLMHQERLIEAGVAPNRVIVTGDIKTSPVIDSVLAYSAKGILIASTHKGEERLLVEALLPLSELLMIAPRHPERFCEVAELLKEMGVSFVTYSSKEPLGSSQVLLIDAIGVLPQFYKAAKVSVLGGSFVQGIGGHNLLEPLFYDSIPVYGPFIEKQTHLKQILDLHEVGSCIGAKGVFDEVKSLLEGPGSEERISSIKGQLGGALAKTMSILRSEIN